MKMRLVIDLLTSCCVPAGPFQTKKMDENEDCNVEGADENEDEIEDEIDNDNLGKVKDLG